MIQDDSGRFLIVQMVSYGENEWRFPGGGIEPGESAEAALLRELAEELGTTNFEIIARCQDTNKYDWPDELIESQFIKRKTKYRGQEQVQFLVKFTGNKHDISPDPKELKQVKWVTYDDLKDHFIFPNQWETVKKSLSELVRK